MATKASPGADRAAVDRDAGDRRPAALPSSRPPVAATKASVVQRALTPCLRRSAAPARASSWSENGSTLSPIDLAGLVALAGDEQDVALLQRRRRPVRIASRRSPISSAFGAPPSTARRIAAGSLAARIVVGDDEPVGVARRRLRPSAGACRDRGRRPRRRRRRACPSRAGAAPSAHWRARRACGRSRRRPARRSDACRPARGGRSRPSGTASASSAFSASTPVAIARPAATSAFEIWNWPTSGSAT